jgi:hypothetical protein
MAIVRRFVGDVNPRVGNVTKDDRRCEWGYKKTWTSLHVVAPNRI